LHGGEAVAEAAARLGLIVLLRLGLVEECTHFDWFLLCQRKRDLDEKLVSWVSSTSTSSPTTAILQQQFEL
jgi:hypothetical protein